MLRRKWALMLAAGIGALAAVAVAISVFVSIHAHDQLYADADRFAERASLPSLKNSDEAELRVWVEEYVFGNITGYRATAHALTRYDIVYPDGATAAKPIIQSKETPEAKAILAIGKDLSRWSGESWSYPVMDGAGVLIEGVSHGRRFVLYAGNPWHYKDARSVLVVRTLEQIDKGRSGGAASRD